MNGNDARNRIEQGEGGEKMGSPFAAPTFTQFANYVLDEIMPTLSGNEWKLLSCLIRGTWGFVDDETGQRKTEDVLSYAQLKARTGIKHDQTIKKGLGELVKRGYILKRPAEGYHEGLKSPPFVYALNAQWKVKLQDLKSTPRGPKEPRAKKAIESKSEPIESIASENEAIIASENEAIEGESIASKSEDTKERVVSKEIKEPPGNAGNAHSLLVSEYQKRLADKEFYKKHPRLWKADMRAAKAMLSDGYTIEDILGCYDHHKGKPFWSDQRLSLVWIGKNIAEWKRGGITDEPEWWEQYEKAGVIKA